ncbi:MAG: hypothetical protein E7473_02575 [Ruminococcaceae bacterium]|nr:hypothetical protein [Oscillospiraceae bacterium]
MMNKSVLEKLWYNYLSEQQGSCGVKEAELLDSILEYERALLETFTEEQRDLYDKIESAASEKSGIIEKKAFTTGVRLGSAFVYETFCKEG